MIWNKCSKIRTRFNSHAPLKTVLDPCQPTQHQTRETLISQDGNWDSVSIDVLHDHSPPFFVRLVFQMKAGFPERTI